MICLHLVLMLGVEPVGLGNRLQFVGGGKFVQALEHKMRRIMRSSAKYLERVVAGRVEDLAPGIETIGELAEPIDCHHAPVCFS